MANQFASSSSTTTTMEDDISKIPEITMSGKHYKKSDYKLLIIRMIFRMMNKVEEFILSRYDSIKQKLRFESKLFVLEKWLKKLRKLKFISILKWMMNIPFVIMYWIYVAPVLLVVNYLWTHAIEPVIKIICKKSELANSMREHILALFALLQRLKLKIVTERPSELVRFFITTLQEVRFFFC